MTLFEILLSVSCGLHFRGRVVTPLTWASRRAFELSRGRERFGAVIDTAPRGRFDTHWRANAFLFSGFEVVYRALNVPKEFEFLTFRRFPPTQVHSRICGIICLRVRRHHHSEA